MPDSSFKCGHMPELVQESVTTHGGKAMITLQAFCEYLENLLQPRLFADFCPNGLQVEGAPAIHKFATAVTASQAVIERAIEEGVQALIVHHGIFWNRDPQPITGTKKTKIALLLEHNISLIAYHLPLDAHTSIGNNWRAAQELEWKNLQPFLAAGGQAIGVKGTFAEMPVEEFQHTLERYYGHTAASALGGKSKVKSAALVSGGAHRNLIDAASCGVDCFVTGSFDEPAWHQAYEERIHFFALGHHATETIGPRALLQHLQAELGLKGLYLDYQNPF